MKSNSEIGTRFSPELFQVIFDRIPNMVFLKSAAELRFVRMNQAGLDLLGVNEADLLGKNDFDFFPKEQAQFFVQKDRSVLEEGRTVLIPVEPIDTPLGRRFLRTRKIPLYDDQGEACFLLGISEDITEIRLQDKVIAEQRQSMLFNAKMSSLGQMAGGIAHEINNPLAIISGSAQQMKRLVQDPPEPERWERIKALAIKVEDTVKRISAVVNGLRDFSRDSNQDSYTLVPAVKVINTTLGLCQERLKGRGIDLQISCDPNIKVLIL